MPRDVRSISVEKILKRVNCFNLSGLKTGRSFQSLTIEGRNDRKYWFVLELMVSAFRRLYRDTLPTFWGTRDEK